MFMKCALPLTVLGLVAFSAPAETIQLKEKAIVVGKIISEKHDQVVVDIGYTVLMIPRNQIVKITRTDQPETRAKAGPAPKISPPAAVIESTSTPEPVRGFYATAGRSLPVKSVRDLVDDLGEAVVQVRTPSALGSGFCINEDGYVMTNFHVIEGETQISIEVYHQRNGQLERRSYKQVRIVAMNKFEDMTLLKIEDKDAPKFKSVALGNSDRLAVGERVFAIGSPLGLERTVTEGILSTKTRQMQGELYLQTTTQINPGNSGGPLFDMAGNVIGITNMKITFGEGLGFAIPVESLKFFLDHRDAFAYANDNPSNAYRYLEPPSKTRHTPAEE
jgi:serine protease Do